MRFIFILACTLFFNMIATAQNVPIGSWSDHLSYKSGLSITEGNGKVYCATKGGLIVYNKSDYSTQPVSKVNGLSDVEPQLVNFNPYNNRLIITYQNSNIDILDNGGNIINISDLKTRTIVGDKKIYGIYFINQYAYLACGFGIIVLDMERNEIKDTYYIGTNGAYVQVRDITSDGTYFYAATKVGIYRALLSSPNLADYTNWSLMPGLRTGTYNAIAYLNGKIIANYSAFLTSNQYYVDTLLQYDGVSWSKWTSFAAPGSYQINALKSSYNKLVVSSVDAVYAYDSNFNILSYFGNYIGGASSPKSAVYDGLGNICIADNIHGLVYGEIAVWWFRSYFPNGPASINLNAIAIQDNTVFVAPGSNIGGNSYLTEGVFTYSNGTWSSIKGNYSGIVNLDTIFDIVNVMVDKNDSKHFFASSWFHGVIEFSNGAPVQLYNESNSTLEGIQVGNYDPIWVQGMAQDNNNNFWFTNSYVDRVMSVKKTNGTWQDFDFSSILGTKPQITNLIVDKNDQKWAVLPFPTNGILVFKGGPSSTVNSSNAKKLTTLSGSGNLPSSSVFCIKEDLDGEIWIGTDKGIAVFYAPENVFTNQNFDAQQILIEQDGYVQILLETETIQDIAVDAANRKWIATANSGVYLVSADGTSQINHFDESNSPLYSNNVRKIAINDATGEVFFGTSKGVIAYRGTATEGFEEFTDVYAFPNPVKPGYDGPIAIKGLINNTTIKITDISGTLVYETKSEGGQALWYGKNFEGKKVSSGVYMIFGTNEDGSQKMVTKILIVN